MSAVRRLHGKTRDGYAPPPIATMRPSLFALVLFVGACAVPVRDAARDTVPLESSTRADVGPPNIVLIFADDLGYGDLSCYGQTRWRTPNLDRLAAGGQRFTDFTVAQAVCSASRAALLTGCYPNRVGISGALGPRAQFGLNPAETTLAELCRAAGYATGAFGKWHLGDAPNLLPTRQGFDEWEGLPYSNDMWPLHPSIAKLPPESEARKRGYPQLPWYEGEQIVRPGLTADDQKQFTQKLTERACRFIASNAKRPFFVYLAHPMPHVPIFASSEFEGRSGAGPYGDVIEEIDASVGSVLATLEEHGLAERTLVIFTSDNGPWLAYGEHAGTTGGLREGKGTSWEGGVRVPFVVRWPTGFPGGRVVRTPAMTIDVLPTIASLLQRPAPLVDGVDLSRLLREGDDPALAERALAYYYHANDLEAVRRGKWKLVLPHAYISLAGEPGRDGSPGPMQQLRSGLELYDLETDPGERTDLAGVHPEIVASFEPVLERLRADLGDELVGRKGAGRRALGRASAK